jgi:L-ornithine Nalpha-acyltransferase
MKAALRSRRVECSPVLDDVFRVRAEIFHAVAPRLLGDTGHVRDIDGFDSLATTTHFVVTAGARPVGAVRLLYQNQEVAHATGWRYGIALESKYRLDALPAPGMVLAEPSRFCVLPRWRNSPVALKLTASLYFESMRWGISHWVTVSNAETDSLEDARLTYALAASLGATTRPQQVTPRASVAPPETPELPLYTPGQRERARRGDFLGLRLPPLLRFLVDKLNAKVMGAPIFDTSVGRCSIPTLIELDAIPPRTLEHFAAISSRQPRR